MTLEEARGGKKSNIYFVGVWKETEKNQKHLKKQKKPYSREYVESLGKKIFMSNRNPTVFFFLFPILPTSPVNFSFISALRLLFEPERPNQLLVNKNIFSPLQPRGYIYRLVIKYRARLMLTRLIFILYLFLSCYLTVQTRFLGKVILLLLPFSTFCYYYALLSFRFIIDEQTGRLTIMDAKRTDEGEIKCLAENRAGKIQKAAYLKVRTICAEISDGS